MLHQKRFIGFFLGLGIAIVITGCGAQASKIQMNGVEITQAQITQGQQLYTQYCASCHGINGEGQFPDAPTQPDSTGRRGAPPHNGAGHTWHHGDALLMRYVREGGISLTDPMNWYPMPAFGNQLTEEQITAVLAYIKTFWNEEQRTRQQLVTEDEVSG